MAPQRFPQVLRKVGPVTWPGCFFKFSIDWTSQQASVKWEEPVKETKLTSGVFDSLTTDLSTDVMWCDQANWVGTRK